MNLSDEALMLAVRNGDIEQVTVLFDRYHAHLFVFFLHMDGRFAAEDLVQEVFFRLLKYRETFHEASHFRGWLYRMARNARTDQFRRTSREATHLSTADLSVLERTLSTTDSENRRYQALEYALHELSHDRRELILLSRFQGLTHIEIANLLNIEPGAVRVRIHRAMKELRDIVMRYSEEVKHAM
jgi:RNA polymerase sigma-70 factor (ECF subfamily)